MTARSKPTWSDVKAKLAAFDRPGLIGLVQDLYVTSKDNQAFLHARLGLGDDVLKPCKVTIDRWLSPDGFKSQDTSVTKARKAIADYKKTVGHPEGLAELVRETEHAGPQSITWHGREVAVVLVQGRLRAPYGRRAVTGRVRASLAAVRRRRNRPHP